MNSKVFCAVLGLCFIALTSAGPVIDNGTGHIDNSVHANEHTSVEEALLRKLNNRCANHDGSACMMLKLVTYFNRLLKKSSFEIGDVEITQTSTETVVQDTSRSLNEVESMSDEAQLSEVISNKIWGFIRTRSLKWKITDAADLVISGNNGKDGAFNFGFSFRPDTSSVGESRKKKGGGGLGAIIGIAALKIGLLKALAFKGLALLVGKAVLVSKLALVLALVIGLKKLFSQEKYVTYEVVAHPHHEHHHEHSFSGGGHDGYGGGGGGGGGGGHSGHGGWGRNLDAGSLAYNAHAPAVK